MKLPKALLSGLTCGLFLSHSSVASAQTVVLDFEDLSGFAPMTAGYGGVANWGSWGHNDAPDPNYPAASGVNRIFSVGLQSRIQFGQDVVFDGANVVAAQAFSWKMFYQGQEVATSAILQPNTGGPAVWVASGYAGLVDELEYVQVVNSHSVDDFTYTIPDAGMGTPFCDPGSTNSTGGSTELAGSPSTSAGSGLHLEMTGGVPGQLAYMLAGNEATAGVAISDGLFCLVGTPTAAFYRYNVAGSPMNSIGGFDATGTWINTSGTSSTGFGFDVPGTIPSGVPITIMAGDTWHFQGWYRDTPAGAGHSNFSNGLSVTF